MKTIKNWEKFNESEATKRDPERETEEQWLDSMIDLGEDMDSRLQGNDEWEEFVNSEFDKYGVDNWFDYYHEGGAIEDAIDFGEQCCINDYNS